MLVFLSNDRPIAQSTMSFTITPHIAKLPSYYANDEYQYAGIRGNTYFVQPYAYFLFLYQLPVYLPGIVFFLVVVAGLVGVVRRWRSWGRLAALPWALAATSIVLPAMLTQSLYRYTIVAVPLACIAAGMAFLRPDPKLEPAASQAGAVPVPVPAADITSPAAADITTLPPSAEPASAEPAPPDTARADAAATADADADDMAGDSRPADPARADPPESDGQASGNGSSPADPADVPDP
jgi:hypothetical protein